MGKRESQYFVFIFIISLVFFFTRIWEPNLSGDSLNYAVIAKDIVFTKNWLVLNLDGMPYFKKPPLLFWLIALSFKVFGISAFSARLPVAFFGVLDALLVYALGKKIFKESEIALVASLFYVINFHVIRLNTIVRFESVEIFFILLNILLFINKKYIWGGLALGLGILTKGPFAFFGVIAFLIWKLFLKETDFITYRFFIGILVALVVSVPWYIYQIYYSSKFSTVFFVDQILNRITGTLSEGTRRGFEFYFVKLARRFWPGLPFFLTGLYFYFRGKLFRDRLILFSFIYIIVVFLIINIPEEKFTRYLYYLYPFTAIFCALSVKKVNITTYVVKFFGFLTVVYLFVGLFYPGVFHHPFGGSRFKTYERICKSIKKNYSNVAFKNLNILEESYFNFYCIKNPLAKPQATLVKNRGAFYLINLNL